MNAYELADKLDANVWGGVHPDIKNCSNMLRQQADRIAELEKELEECWCGGHSYSYLRAKNRLPQTKPLSDEEILGIWEGLFENEDDIVHIHNFARAIEERHGIK